MKMGGTPHARGQRAFLLWLNTLNEEAVMGIRGRIFAGMYDRIMANTEKAGLSDRRADIIARAKGDVLEIGAGTGANLGRYPAHVTTLTVTEPEPAMVKRLRRHVETLGREVMVLRAPGEDLPFADDTFDTVVSTLTLCTVDDQPRTLREIHRVLRPGGQLLFIEHVRADDAKAARRQDRLNGLNRVMAAGCNCNRSTADTLAANGFAITSIEHGELYKAPPWLRPLIAGVAAAV
jgi:SAM-dependent methyltransferase